GLRLGLDRRERGRTGGVETSGMTETTCADARAAIGIGRDVEDDVVGTRGITGHSADTRQGARGGHVVQSQKVAHAPSDIVVRTAEYRFAVESAKPAGRPDPLLDDELSRLKALAVLAFCAEMTRLPGHCAPRFTPENATAHTTPSRFTMVAHI